MWIMAGEALRGIGGRGLGKGLGWKSVRRG